MRALPCFVKRTVKNNLLESACGRKGAPSNIRKSLGCHVSHRCIVAIRVCDLPIEGVEAISEIAVLSFGRNINTQVPDTFTFTLVTVTW